LSLSDTKFLRQEPVIFANGYSFTPREATRLNENMEFPGISGEALELLQEELVQVVRARAERVEGQLRYYRGELVSE